MGIRVGVSVGIGVSFSLSEYLNAFGALDAFQFGFEAVAVGGFLLGEYQKSLP
jgi:hypothetical protein